MSSATVCKGSRGGPCSLKYPISLLLIVLAVSVAAFAASDSSDGADAAEGDDGNIHWAISGDTLTLSKKNG